MFYCLRACYRVFSRSCIRHVASRTYDEVRLVLDAVDEVYDALDIVNTKINQTYENDNPFNYIMRGLLLEKQGDLQDAITILDEFVAKEPDLIITPAVKGYIQKLVKKVY